MNEKVEIRQLTIQNYSNQLREVSLWGMNKDLSISSPLDIDVQDLKISLEQTSKGTYPQGIVQVNSGNYYLMNQLSDNVSVLDHEGKWLKDIDLGSSFPGTLAPIRAVQNPESKELWIICALADKVIVLNEDDVLVVEIPTDRRPMDITYRNGKMHIIHGLGSQLMILDAESKLLQSTINAQGRGIVSYQSGIISLETEQERIRIFDQNNQLIQQINTPGRRPLQGVVHPIVEKLFVSIENSNELISVDLNNFIMQILSVGNHPDAVIYNEQNNYVYVANSLDDTISIINGQSQVVETLPLGQIGVGMIVSGRNLLTTHSISSSYRKITYQFQSSSIEVDPEYYEIIQEYQYHPVEILHSKWVWSGDQRTNILSIISETTTGSKESKQINFNHYLSPQNFLNIAEVVELRGEVIDAKHYWRFCILPSQRVTLLLYYYKNNNRNEFIKEAYYEKE